MDHFPEEVWVDLARGTLPRNDDAARHVSECFDCRRQVETFSRLSELGRKESSYSPAPGILVRARELFSPARPDPVPITARIAELLYDSLRSPALAGIRGTSTSIRHLTYMTASYHVDVRIEEQDGGAPASVVGQILRLPYSKEAPLEGLTVTLARGSVALSTTKTNRMGEFQLDVDTRKAHRISLGIGSEFSLVVPLPARRRPRRTQ